MSNRIRFGAVVSPAFLGFVASSVMLVSTIAWGQGIPGQSVNIIGPTPEIDYMLPDKGLKQQNEVNCTVRPGDPLVAFCGYNDYRTTEKTGDAWVGASMTRDGGLTWTSRLAPGWPQYTPGVGPVGHDFAADPSTVAVPGLVLYNFIAADRKKNGTGGLFLQRWFESDKENGFPYLPDRNTSLITKGTSCPQCSGRFIDKPHMIATLNPGGAPVTVSGVLEDGVQKSVQVPAGELHVVYSVFTGSKQDSSKILHSYSSDWGKTWSVDSKITESVDINQSANLVARGNDLLVVWRRFSDNNESNALMYALSSDRGKTWSSPLLLAELNCPYDQPTANNMFRTTVHPVAATDGSGFYAFWSQRGDDPVLNECQFGLSRIVMSKLQGSTWSTPVPIENTEALGRGHQFMPAVTAANGVMQVAWYDTRDSMLPVHNEGVMDGLFENTTLVARHSVDVRGKQITGGNLDNPSVRLSRYPLIPLTPDYSIQLGFNFVNARMFAGGKVPFIGDYISVAAPDFRLNAAGQWENNQGPGAFEPTTFFAAWTDNRDVRGDAWGDIFGVNTPYSSNANIPPKATNDLEPGTETNYTPGSCSVGALVDRTRDQNVYATTIKPGAALTLPTRNKRLGALQRGFVVNVENANRKSEQEFTFCIDGQPSDNTGEADMTGIASFNQYPAPISGFGLNTKIDPVTTLNVTVPAQSNSAQSVYVTSAAQAFPHIPVSAYKGTFQCDETRGELVSTVVINGDMLARDLLDPNADPVVECTVGEPGCAPQAGQLDPIAAYEVHDPQIINYLFAMYHIDADDEFFDASELNRVFTQALYTNPLIMTRDGTSNPLIMTRDVTNPLIMTRDSTSNPLIMTRDDETNPLIMTSGKTTNPLIMTKDGSTNPLIMTRDDVDNPLIMTRDSTSNPLIMTRDAYDNPLIMTLDDLSNPLIMTRDAAGNPLVMTLDGAQDAYGNPLIMTRDELDNPLIMTRDPAGNPLVMTLGGGAGKIAVPASAFCSQAEIDSDTCVLPAGYVEVTWLVENEGNTVTAYNALPMIAGGSLVDGDGNLIPTQVIVTKPYVTLASRGCETGWQVINQVLLNSTNPFVENADGTWSVDPGKATFFSGPGEEITITLRVFDPTFNPYRLGFAVQSQSCNSGEGFDLDCGVEPIAAIEVDTTAPGAPVITGQPVSPLDFLEAGSASGTFAEWLAASEDDDGSPADVSCVATFGDQTVDVNYDASTGKFSATFPIGVRDLDTENPENSTYTATTVTCTATDEVGNSSSKEFEVLVLDTINPILTATPLVADPEATSAAGAVVNFSLSATDFGLALPLDVNTPVCSATEVSPEPPLTPITISPFKTGDVLPLGAWVVTCSATDAAGNIGSASFTVTVKDTTAPSLAQPADITGVEATSFSGAAVSFALPVATDAVGVTTHSCSPASGSTFALGTTAVTCTAGDAAGNSASTGFSVTVVDTTPPALAAMPVLAEVEATSATGAVVTYTTPGATDIFGATVSCTPASGSAFAIGSTTVTCVATDGNGLTSTDAFTVTVADNTAPLLVKPADITAVEATSSSGAVVSFALPVATDAVGVTTQSCSPASGSTFALGTTAVTCTAGDAAGNSASTGFSVTVVDTTAPSLVKPADITGVEATSSSGALVSFALPVATDAVGVTTYSCSPASGSIFALGVTTVSCSATDGSGNTGGTSFSVTVIDTTAPVVAEISNITTEAVGATTPVSYSTTASDLVSGSLPVTCVPASGTGFAVGTTPVSCSATDAKGNTGTTSFSVTITDTTAPVFGPVNDITAPATSPAGATVNYTVTATDLVSGAVTVTCTPASPHTFALGSTPVTCTAKDAAGNTSTRTFTVKVQYGSFLGMNLPNGMTGTGADTVLDLGETALGTYSRSIPLEWRYGDVNKVAMASGSADPTVHVERFGKKLNGSCDFSTASIDAQDSGNSAMRYTSSSLNWKFSWKPSSGAGCYGITIRSGQTGQSNGPFLFELR